MPPEFDGWVVKDSRCACCSEQGALVLVVCKGCCRLSIVCDEVGTVYFDPHDLANGVYGGVASGLKCPECNCDYCDFVPANEVHVQAAGFPVGYALFQTAIPDPR